MICHTDIPGLCGPGIFSIFSCQNDADKYKEIIRKGIDKQEKLI